MRYRLYFVILLSLLIMLCSLMVGCGDDDDSSDEASDDDDDDTTDDDDDDDDDDTSDEFLNVEEDENLGYTWECEMEPGLCTKGYLDFMDIAAPYLDSMTEAELKQATDDITNYVTEIYQDPMPPEQLKNGLIDALNIDFLLDGINETLLTVTTIDITETEDYTEKELLFTDPFVGTFQGFLQIPKYEEPPYPAAILIHGHGGNAEWLMEFFPDLPSLGYAALYLTMRVNSNPSADTEDIMTKELLLSGFSLLGIRNYEVLLGFKYLRWREDVGNDQIGLLGHSGGGVSNNVLVRYEDRFGAYVTDCEGSYYTMWGNPFSDEVNPFVHPYWLLINDYSTSQVPIQVEPYEFTDGSDGVYQFFDEQLMK